MRRGLHWTPILSGRRRERAREIVGTIADDLRARFSVSASVSDAEAWSLATGRSGVALFLAYLGEHDLAARLVEESLDAAASVAGVEYLFEGFAGVAWTLAHVDGWLLDVSDGDPNDAVDAALLDLVKAAPWTGEYDLLAGLAGIGVYAVERLPRPRAHDVLVGVVARLSELAKPRWWWTPVERMPGHVRQDYPTGAWNLGAAHGSPGVIGLLAKAQAAGVTTARPVLDRAVDWLLDQRLASDAVSTFPSWVAPDATSRRTRLAWCYGDAGVAGTLLVASRQAGVLNWETEAVVIAERAAARAIEDSGVVDASVCHGSAGLAHIFNRLYQATGSPVLHAAAEHWLEHVLTSEPLLEPGLLTGSAGVGLVLLAATTSVEPRWDRLFLLS